jgi:prolyl oligopeptidase
MNIRSVSASAAGFLLHHRRQSAALAILLLSHLAACTASKEHRPPPSRRAAVTDTLHGVDIVDHYRWLEDQQSPETRAWVDAQNTFTHAVLDPLPVVPEIQKRLTALLRVDDQSLPAERAGRYFSFRKKADQDLQILCMRQGVDGEDHVLIDPHSLSADHTTSISLSGISHDGKLLAYGIRQGGLDEIEIRVREVESGIDRPDVLPAGLYRSLAFTHDSQGFYYGLHDRRKGVRIYYHKLGDDRANDQEVFGEGYGPDKWISVEVSGNGRYVLYAVRHGWGRSELYVQDLKSKAPLRTLVKDVDAAFTAEFADDILLAQTDWEAPKRRILAIDLSKPAADWEQLIAEAADSIEDFSAVGGKILVRYLHDVSSQIKVFSATGKPLGDVPVPQAATANSPRGRWDSAEAFYEFESYTQPPVIYRLDTASMQVSLWKSSPVPFDPAPFETKQVWFASKDGTKVPMFLIHRAGLALDGGNPALLYGYGGFNVSLLPRFRSSFAVWIERGGVLAVPNLRGGGEFGEAWHRAGMLQNKQNVFDDFIAAAEWLIANRYTQPSRLAIQGGSNGGLLVGAALTQRPELYQAVLCTFPDLDMVRYDQFENNNKPALLEYGNAADPAQFQFLYAYSPYQRVKEGTNYPAVLLTSGDADTRVPPLQARKMAAALQHATASPRPVLLLYDTKAGHSGGKPLSKLVEDQSLEIAFLMSQTGLN